MNNISATPTHFANEEDEEWANFLAFTQHVQYFKTKKMAFVADYQGKSIFYQLVYPTPQY